VVGASVIDAEVLIEWPWATATELSALAVRAVSAAIAETPQAELASLDVAIEISIRLTSDAEVQTLNRQYRGKNEPTNVLSFPMVQPDLIEGLANSDDGEILLGDIVLGHETCSRESEQRGVSLEAHALHLIVHGTLHLLGYDHMHDDEAEHMESLEREIMGKLGLHDPYEPIED
jgi:probable rRNA maturation factor